MIVVLANAQTRHNGSMYSNSATTGNWEDFMSRDLVAYIDSHYRTIANRLSRGIAGHSMGGYGTVRIAMRHPDVFSALLRHEPLLHVGPRSPARRNGQEDRGRQSLRQPPISLDFFARATFAAAAAWSPNPKDPPLYLDLPTKNGVPQPAVLARWAANAPLAMVDQYIGNLRQYRAIALDVGDLDGLRPTRPNSIVFWTATASPTASTSTAAITSAPWRIAGKITSCRSSAGTLAADAN